MWTSLELQTYISFTKQEQWSIQVVRIQTHAYFCGIDKIYPGYKKYNFMGRES